MALLTPADTESPIKSLGAHLQAQFAANGPVSIPNHLVQPIESASAPLHDEGMPRLLELFTRASDSKLLRLDSGAFCVAIRAFLATEPSLSQELILFRLIKALKKLKQSPSKLNLYRHDHTSGENNIISFSEYLSDVVARIGSFLLERLLSQDSYLRSRILATQLLVRLLQLYGETRRVISQLDAEKQPAFVSTFTSPGIPLLGVFTADIARQILANEDLEGTFLSKHTIPVMKSPHANWVQDIATYLKSTDAYHLLTEEATLFHLTNLESKNQETADNGMLMALTENSIVIILPAEKSEQEESDLQALFVPTEVVRSMKVERNHDRLVANLRLSLGEGEGYFDHEGLRFFTSFLKIEFVDYADLEAFCRVFQLHHRLPIEESSENSGARLDSTVSPKNRRVIATVDMTTSSEHESFEGEEPFNVKDVRKSRRPTKSFYALIDMAASGSSGPASNDGSPRKNVDTTSHKDKNIVPSSQLESPSHAESQLSKKDNIASTPSTSLRIPKRHRNIDSQNRPKSASQSIRNSLKPRDDPKASRFSENVESRLSQRQGNLISQPAESSRNKSETKAGVKRTRTDWDEGLKPLEDEARPAKRPRNRDGLKRATPSSTRDLKSKVGQNEVPSKPAGKSQAKPAKPSKGKMPKTATLVKRPDAVAKTTKKNLRASGQNPSNQANDLVRSVSPTAHHRPIKPMPRDQRPSVTSTRPQSQSKTPSNPAKGAPWKQMKRHPVLHPPTQNESPANRNSGPTDSEEAATRDDENAAEGSIDLAFTEFLDIENINFDDFIKSPQPFLASDGSINKEESSHPNPDSVKDSFPLSEDHRKRLVEEAAQSFGSKLSQSLREFSTLISGDALVERNPTPIKTRTAVTAVDNAMQPFQPTDESQLVGLNRNLEDGGSEHLSEKGRTESPRAEAIRDDQPSEQSIEFKNTAKFGEENVNLEQPQLVKHSSRHTDSHSEDLQLPEGDGEIFSKENAAFDNEHIPQEYMDEGQLLENDYEGFFVAMPLNDKMEKSPPNRISIEYQSTQKVPVIPITSHRPANPPHSPSNLEPRLHPPERSQDDSHNLQPPQPDGRNINSSKPSDLQKSPLRTAMEANHVLEGKKFHREEHVQSETPKANPSTKPISISSASSRENHTLNGRRGPGGSSKKMVDIIADRILPPVLVSTRKLPLGGSRLKTPRNPTHSGKILGGEVPVGPKFYNYRTAENPAKSISKSQRPEIVPFGPSGPKLHSTKSLSKIKKPDSRENEAQELPRMGPSAHASAQSSDEAVEEMVTNKISAHEEEALTYLDYSLDDVLADGGVTVDTALKSPMLQEVEMRDAGAPSEFAAEGPEQLLPNDGIFTPPQQNHISKQTATGSQLQSRRESKAHSEVQEIRDDEQNDRFNHNHPKTPRRDITEPPPPRSPDPHKTPIRELPSKVLPLSSLPPSKPLSTPSRLMDVAFEPVQPKSPTLLQRLKAASSRPTAPQPSDANEKSRPNSTKQIAAEDIASRPCVVREQISNEEEAERSTKRLQNPATASTTIPIVSDPSSVFQDHERGQKLHVDPDSRSPQISSTTKDQSDSAESPPKTHEGFSLQRSHLPMSSGRIPPHEIADAPVKKGVVDSAIGRYAATEVRRASRISPQKRSREMKGKEQPSPISGGFLRKTLQEHAKRRAHGDDAEVLRSADSKPNLEEFDTTLVEDKPTSDEVLYSRAGRQEQPVDLEPSIQKRSISTSSSESSDDNDEQRIHNSDTLWSKVRHDPRRPYLEMLYEAIDMLQLKLVKAEEGVQLKVRELERGGSWVLDQLSEQVERYIEGQDERLEARRKELIEAYGDILKVIREDEKTMEGWEPLATMHGGMKRRDEGILQRLEEMETEMEVEGEV
ncbi:MAG: hypothetical protein Q9227_009053 [Pyrenula ochraceoflavens]